MFLCSVTIFEIKDLSVHLILVSLKFCNLNDYKQHYADWCHYVTCVISRQNITL